MDERTTYLSGKKPNGTYEVCPGYFNGFSNHSISKEELGEPVHTATNIELSYQTIPKEVSKQFENIDANVVTLEQKEDINRWQAKFALQFFKVDHNKNK